MRNKVAKLFMEALDEIMSSHEIENVINWADDEDEKKELEYFRKQYKRMKEEFDTIPIWEVLSTIESTMLFKDIITMMVLFSAKEGKEDAN